MEHQATIPIHLNRLHALLTRWGGSQPPQSGEIDGGMSRFQVFVADMREAFQAVSRGQTDAYASADQRIIGALNRAFAVRGPDGFVLQEAEIVDCLAEVAAANAEAWSCLSGRIRSHYAQLVGTNALDPASSRDPRPVGAERSLNAGSGPPTASRS